MWVLICAPCCTTGGGCFAQGELGTKSFMCRCMGWGQHLSKAWQKGRFPCESHSGESSPCHVAWRVPTPCGKETMWCQTSSGACDATWHSPGTPSTWGLPDSWGLGELREGGFWGASSLCGEMSPFLLSFLFLQSRAHALAFPPALPYLPAPAGPGTGAAGDSPMAPSPHQHGEVGLAGALRGAQCWEIIPANPDHNGSALQCPSGCAGIAFWCQQGSHQHHLLVLSDKVPVVPVQAHSSFLPVPHGTAHFSRMALGVSQDQPDPAPGWVLRAPLAWEWGVPAGGCHPLLLHLQSVLAQPLTSQLWPRSKAKYLDVPTEQSHTLSPHPGPSVTPNPTVP